MSANVSEAAGKFPGANLAPDDITQIAYKAWGEQFRTSRAETEQFQLRSAQQRFDDLMPRIPAVKEIAERQGVTRINALNDLVPLLFNHNVMKSYPMSLLENSRFDMLTRWFDRLTPLDLSGIDASKCESIDGWMTLLEAKTPLQIFHTTGTTGKLSFIPRTQFECDLWYTVLIKNIREYAGPGNEKLRLPVIYPSMRYGRYAFQRALDYYAKDLAPSPDQVYTLNTGTLSADLVSLSGRIRVAQAKGELARMKFSDAQRFALKRYFDELDRRPQETAEFFARMTDQLRGQTVYLTSQASYVWKASVEGIERGIKGVFAPDSLGLAGGGGKGTILPPDWKDTLVRFSGIPRERWETNSYGMSELTGPMPGCREGYAHIPPYIIPFLLDPETGALLPRESRQTGRFAAFDLAAQNLWGGIISSDKITIEWDRDCPCGRKGAHIHDSIERYSATMTGDDKVTCSATVDNTDAALQSLLGR